MGLSVLYAAHLAEHHASKAEIAAFVKRAERLISSAFIIDNTHMMCRSGRISKRVQVLCDALLLHPILVLKKSKMVLGGVEVGGFANVAKKYIRRVLQETRTIDRRILFITYSGLDTEKLQYIQDLVQQYCPFERVYLQKASSAIASNCGPGSFGLLFLRKDGAA
jgi:fatty acid-binding protein DegV